MEWCSVLHPEGMRYGTISTRTLSVALGALLAAVLSSVPAHASPPGPSAPDQPDVIVAQAAPGKKLHFPNMERRNDGSLVAVAREGEGHTGQDGRLLILDSDDGGRTWSSPRVVHDSPYDDRDPMITQLGSGRLLLSWFETDWTTSPRTRRGVFVKHSDDGGTTWSDPVRVQTSMSEPRGNPDLGWAAGHGQIKELPSGELIIPLYGTLPDDPWQRSTVVRSMDGGESWKAETESLIAAKQNTHYQEPVLTVLPGGKVHALLRIGTAASTMDAVRSQESWSDDGGRTWTVPEEIDLVTSSAHTEVLRNGDVFLAYGDLSGHFTDRRGTVGAVLRNPGSSWSGAPRELVYDSGTGDQANPAVAEVRPGRVLVLGFDSDTGRLVGDYVDANSIRDEPADPRRVDLAALHDAGLLTIDTDLVYTTADRPHVGPVGAIDGVVGYWDAAWKNTEAPAHYTVTFDEPTRVMEVGVALKPGHAEAAVVKVRDASGSWRTVGELDNRVRWGDELAWFPVGPGRTIDKVKVEIIESAGWAVLAELGVRGPGAN
ncbi:BNR repeat protein [Actinomadura hallensis]|uniref:BNR repeat protein n=1 Tax=Actinomadura hallensis TaxID=337895 RepID=A0A543I7T9_9ACTN|nr:BNR repeat protein [Actinomadura hallensis]